MVAAQLQLKWPNHSTQLLTGLKSLFKNEQLVDCTLKCNTHILKVHRSVLAACSPYFERELKNNPSVVIEDMQFTILKSLIEFMYYGETHVSEDNLTALIQAAQLFEVKGLSEMDLFSSDANIISSVVSASNNPALQNGSDKIENIAFTDPSQSFLNTCGINIDSSIGPSQQSVTSEDSNDSNTSTLIIDSPNLTHTNRHYVVTPPQTESAQILLSLARSYSEKQRRQQQICTAVTTSSNCSNPPLDAVIQSSNDPNSVFLTTTANNFLLNNVGNGSAIPPSGEMENQLECAPSSIGIGGAAVVINDPMSFVKYTGSSTSSSEDKSVEDSVLAKLLNKNVNVQHDQMKNSDEGGSSRFCGTTLYNGGASARGVSSGTAVHSDILDYPFVIETNDGYVGVPVDDSMFGVFDNCEIFDPHSGNRNCGESDTSSILPKECLPSLSMGGLTVAAVPSVPCFSARTRIINEIDEEELQKVKQDTESELVEDPDAVVLCKVNENGQVEKYVLSSGDIAALKLMNQQMKELQRDCADGRTGCGGSVESYCGASIDTSAHIELELPTSTASGAATSLITRIFEADNLMVQNAISKLPFKKKEEIPTNNNKAKIGPVKCPSEIVTSSEMNAADRILQNAVEAHPHENMFEELDSQFSSMDGEGCMEKIQRDFVAYEEASKHETQLEHNYYANAMKDEEADECVISDENYDELRSMMLIEEPEVAAAALANLSSATTHNQLKQLKNTVVPATTDPYRVAIVDHDVYLKGGNCIDEENARESRRNGGLVGPAQCNMFISSGSKIDLITNTDALMSSTLARSASLSPPKNKILARTNGALDDFRSLKNGEEVLLPTVLGIRAAPSIANCLVPTAAHTTDSSPMLPFRKVKNSSSSLRKNSAFNSQKQTNTAKTEKKPKRTYQRKSASSRRKKENVLSNTMINSNSSMNGMSTFYEGCSLIEEIIVDEVV